MGDGFGGWGRARWRHLDVGAVQSAIGALTLACLLVPARVGGDAIVITRAMTASTIAELFIDGAGVRAEIEIGAVDLPAFRNLMPDGLVERMGFAAEPLADRLPRFFLEDLVIRGGDGRPLPGRVLELEPRRRVARDELTGEPLPAADGEGETVVFAVLQYPFASPPTTLTIAAPHGDRGVVTASIGFVAYHQGLPVNDFRYLGREETLDLDWEDPWYSRFRNRNLRRQYDAPLNTFLYVEPYEVRTEIIVRPRDLQQWVDLGLEGRDTIPVEMQPEIRRKVGEFLGPYSKVMIDGEPAIGTLDRVHFLRRTLRNSTVIDPPEELDAAGATLGVIFVYPTTGLPQEATLTWELFSPRIQRIPAAATDEAGPLRFFLQPDDNVLWWKNFLKNPTLPTLVEIAPPPGLSIRLSLWLGWLLVLATVVVLGRVVMKSRRKGSLDRSALAEAVLLALVAVAALGWATRSRIDDERAEEIFGGLLHNVYRSFDFRDESAIYDVLAKSVSGDLLTAIYLETRRGLELASQGGARAKVKEVEVVSVSAEDLEGREGFRALAKWNVSGSVGHWGHIHRRTNQYEAELTVEPVEGVWKLTGLELLREERL